MANRGDLVLNFKWALCAILICAFLCVRKSTTATKVPYVASHMVSCLSLACYLYSIFHDFVSSEVTWTCCVLQLSDGTIVDCVKVEEQPTLQDLKFKDHVVQVSTSISCAFEYLFQEFKFFESLTFFVFMQQSPSADLYSSIKLSGPGDKETHIQLFQKEIGSCPQGTIPIQRMDEKNAQDRVSICEHVDTKKCKM